ncbi:hypothetical protein NQ315_002896 [Exocentrus adspersus]|uniref:Integrase catalytic domain-containing protein n=1 Tax=Exocentrus adspersus TaxID=1586481 RepID=A0AAV8VFN4_9CUCU|nr:hypothetical protein NQ315_002896 [Exocentrus adspersus]
MALLEIKKTRMTPLHPQPDVIVERHNRTINQYLSMFVSENQRNWDKLIPLFLLAYRSSQHEATGYTPSMLLTGREMKLPIDLIRDKPLTDDEDGDRATLPEFVASLEERLKTVHEFARNRLFLTTVTSKVG